ncbi:hypothetical protein [Clostridium magnum]|uniref:Fimbrial assembly protein PilN n=1 Tax=Clostridium magnum DSM 2767 TaxID=1121326 RepID=A0A162UR69_9CLOT|nr:hypothetical protein [Clostridium magnum]KZL94207.1 hypothetical protein CLMAG_12600 [Clostridium magnum DSM 2767]SHH92820.1 hypothetical protein SAMN02745944_01793 [Clostridium magnum DSM 2767]
MERISFLPQWYLENKINKKRKIMKLCIGMLIIIDLIFLDILILRLNEAKLLDDNIKKKISAEKSVYLNKKKENYGSDKTLSTFFIFIKSMPIDINFKNISVENRNVNIEINPEVFDYISFVNELEHKNEFIVKSLEPANEQENKNFKANLEMK